MPFVLLIVGVLIIVVAIRNTQGQLGQLIVSDFTGPGNFFYWIAAIFIIGGLGYVDTLKAPSRAMLALVLIALIISNQGFFNSFVAQLSSGSAQAPPPGPPTPQPNSGSGGGGNSGGGGGKSGGGAGSTIGGIGGGIIGAVYGGPVGGAVGSSVGSSVGGSILN